MRSTSARARVFRLRALDPFARHLDQLLSDLGIARLPSEPQEAFGLVTAELSFAALHRRPLGRNEEGGNIDLTIRQAFWAISVTVFSSV